ncbi:E3 ubiquitin-protein ligase rnf152 [Alosa alosa]|uniref:E3 ubiquitin-protein ligase rnf152 n=1 Tax=Alosa alosa TaxID=278164 RepID=UPI0020151B56|nr:E3 ubiquitin-protein ligase rnf152 [Alosa alosa]
MSSRGQDPQLECQICFHFYSSWRRPKLLGCGHTCCSVCLRRICRARRELACPWCRSLTLLPKGLSVSELPDDPQTLPLLVRQAPVFMRLPGHDCYLLPLAVDAQAPLLPAELAPCLVRACQLKGVTMVTHADNRMLDLESGGGGVGVEGEEYQREEQEVEQSRWTKVCTVVLVVIIFLLLLGVILQNITCVSKPFTIISCG